MIEPLHEEPTSACGQPATSSCSAAFQLSFKEFKVRTLFGKVWRSDEKELEEVELVVKSLTVQISNIESSNCVAVQISNAEAFRATRREIYLQS